MPAVGTEAHRAGDVASGGPGWIEKAVHSGCLEPHQEADLILVNRLTERLCVVFFLISSQIFCPNQKQSRT